LNPLEIPNLLGPYESGVSVYILEGGRKARENGRHGWYGVKITNQKFGLCVRI
jgi:hypothetical protein